MKGLIHSDFLLYSPLAQHLFRSYAETLPIIDYHCHLSPQEIYEDRIFDNITQLWLGGDHYKWRLMRTSGVPEKYITGNADDRDKFQKWAETISLAIGNPLYHWSHLELSRYFGYDGILNGETAEEVWQLCNEKLRTPDFSVRNLIAKSNVKVICTTDDPSDSLEWHSKIKSNPLPGTQVIPAFRPDKAIKIESPDYLPYLDQLHHRVGFVIDSFSSLINALEKRMDFFETFGCRTSDHGVSAVSFRSFSEDQVNLIFQNRLNGILPSTEEQEIFHCALLLALGRSYARRGWVMQLHYGASRNNSSRLYQLLGPDAGGDAIGSAASMDELASFLDALDSTDELPKTILYSLNPNDNAAIVSVMGCFQNDDAVGKLQHGSAWWFNDHYAGMISQMTTLANEGMLAHFVGMLTDSRSFLSYTRHEYFRRILCDLIASWVNRGQFPNDEKTLQTIIEGICYNNALNYFGFSL